MRLVMLGTGPFAVPTLRALAASRHAVAHVVTRPPRGRRPEPPPMQTAAEDLGIPVWQPETLNDEAACATLRDLAADLLVVCDYGEILKPPALAAARLGGINLHGSLLPKYRGAAPVQWAVINGDAETGSTVIQMTPGLDAGPILGVDRTAIDPNETAGQLEARLALRGGELTLQVVDALEAGTATPESQDKRLASKAPRLDKEMGRIDWSRPAATIKNLVRGLDPWPRAYTEWRRAGGEPLRLILHKVESLASTADAAATPGVVVEADERLVVAAGEGTVEIVTLQPAGKRAMTAAELLRGYGLKPGERLG
jgi:methionyl-tRNA formyltransferase